MFFFGLNGSGKTSLLKILHSAMSLDASLVENVYFKNAKVTIYTLNHKREFTLVLDKGADQQKEQPELPFDPARLSDWTRLRLTAERSRQPQWQYIDPIPEVKDAKRWRHTYLPTTRLYLVPFGRMPGREPEADYGDYFGRTAMYTEDSLERLFAASMRYLWQSEASAIYSGVRDAQAKGLANILRDVLAPTQRSSESATPADLQTARRRVESFLRRQSHDDLRSVMSHFDEQFASDPRIQRVVSDINTVETKIEETMTPLRNFSSLLSQLYSGGKSVVVSERGISVFLPDREELALDNLSAGEKHVLRLFVDALFAEENSLMIDEPELSLHVDWQKALIGYMRTLNQHMQLIIATHSPEVMADVPDANIRRL
jgi:ABC-type molybdenum transport system ATPase subunit/photorepair protein PhrA